MISGEGGGCRPCIEHTLTPNQLQYSSPRLVRVRRSISSALLTHVPAVFISELTCRAWLVAESNKRRTLQRSDVAGAVELSDQFDFLIDILPRGEEANKRSKSKAAEADVEREHEEQEQEQDQEQERDQEQEYEQNQPQHQEHNQNDVTLSVSYHLYMQINTQTQHYITLTSVLGPFQ